MVRNKINCLLDDITDSNKRHTFYVHLYGVSNFAAVIAARRGLEMELSIVAGLMHDVSLLSSDDYENHARTSAEMTQEILTKMGIFLNDEIIVISNAIIHHNEIEVVHSPYDEVLKDADIMHPFFNDIPEPAFMPAIPRLQKVFGELGILINLKY